MCENGGFFGYFLVTIGTIFGMEDIDQLIVTLFSIMEDMSTLSNSNFFRDGLLTN